jgi:hypothetical protein
VASSLAEVAVDCADPHCLARFWCSVLDYEVQEVDGDVVTIGAVAAPLVLTFARVPEGKTSKNRLHLDVRASDRGQAEEVRRLLDLGAIHADVGQGDVSWVTLADPEGNEFCVLAAP